MMAVVFFLSIGVITGLLAWLAWNDFIILEALSLPGTEPSETTALVLACVSMTCVGIAAHTWLSPRLMVLLDAF